MNKYVKLALFVEMPLAALIGSIVTLKFELFLGIIAGLCTAILFGISVFLIKGLRVTFFKEIGRRNIQPNVNVARFILLAVGLLCMATVPLIYVYVPLSKGIRNEEHLLVIGGIEMLLLITFSGAYLRFGKISNSNTEAEQPFKHLPTPGRSFIIMLFAAAIVFICLSFFCSSKVAGLGMLTVYIFYRLYREFFEKHGRNE